MQKTGQEKKPKTSKVGAGKNSGTKKQDCFAIKNCGVQRTGRMEHGAGLELSPGQLQPFDDTVPSQVPDGYEKGSLADEDVDAKCLHMARRSACLHPN